MTGLDLDHQSNAQAEALVSFLCPLCERRLNVPTRLAGIAGPCPSCQNINRAPRVHLGPPIIQPGFVPSGSEQMQALADLGGVESPTVEENRVFPTDPAIRFNATKRIPPTPAEGLDDTWREKVERQRKRSRTRRRRKQVLQHCLGRGKASRKLGIFLILGILGLTICVLYLNHRSGGQLFGGGMGR